MHDVSAHGVDKRMINLHYYYSNNTDTAETSEPEEASYLHQNEFAMNAGGCGGSGIKLQGLVLVGSQQEVAELGRLGLAREHIHAGSFCPNKHTRQINIIIYSWKHTHTPS